MRVSTNWLRDYVDIDVPSEKVANDMLSVGNEYSSINRISIIKYHFSFITYIF